MNHWFGKRNSQTSPSTRRLLSRRLVSESLESRKLLAATPTTPDFVVPTSDLGFEDAAVVDVTNWNADASLNADPAAGNNDRLALQAVIDEYAGTGKIIYFPEGEYEIDQPLVMPILASNRATAYTILQGVNRDRVTIKVSDNAGLNGAALVFQIGTADAFRNAVRDLTIDVGAGNPLADGLRFTGSNQATVRNVHIQSSDPEFAGDVGLELGTGENGPLLVENVSVDGFDIGIRTSIQTASQTFEDISLSNQQQFGWVNEADQNVFVRNLTSVNEVRAVHNFPLRVGQNAVFTLVDSTLQGVGDASNQIAIYTEERLYARNVSTTGYAHPVSYRPSNGFVSGNRDLAGDFIEEYWSEGGQFRKTGGTHELFDGSPDASLGLPIENSPKPPIDSDLTRWASPTSFVTANPDGTPSGIPGDVHDDSLAIQAAIDSGATTIYFPNEGRWLVEGLVEIRGNVERFLGLESTINTLTGDGRVRISETTAEVLVIERIDGGGAGRQITYEHASDETVVIRNLSGFAYQPVVDAPGDLFLYDVSLPRLEVRNQNVWARQLNVEVAADVNDPSLPDEKILNDNANLWVLGVKIEKQGTIARTISGGKTELLGVYRNNNAFSDADNPAFVTVDASTSVVNFDAATAAGNAYALWASETREGETRTSERFGGGHVYAAFDDANYWDVSRQVVIDNLDPDVTYVGDWQSSATLPGGYIDSDVAFSSQPGASATFAPELPVDGQYEVYVRWINGFGVADHTGHGNAVPVDVSHLGGTESLTLDQRFNGGQWVSIGTYDFAAGDSGAVTIATEGTAENTIVDGVRFSLRSPGSGIPALGDRFPIRPATNVLSEGIFSGGEYMFDQADGLIANDIESNGLPLTVTAVSSPTGGEVVFQSDGSFTYSPYPWFRGADHFTYTVTNGTQSATGNVLTFVEDPVDPVTGEFRRERTVAEGKEQITPVIETVGVESTGGGFGSSLLNQGRLPGIGVGGVDGHQRDGNRVHFTGPADTQATLDLGGVYTVETVRLWNHNEIDEDAVVQRQTTSGARVLNIYADSDSDGNAFADELVLIRTVELAEAPGRTDYSGQVFDLGGIEARYIRLEVVDNHGNASESALSDVEFRGNLVAASSSPEVPLVFVQDVSSFLNADRVPGRTLGSGYSAIDNAHTRQSRGANWESGVDDAMPSVTYDLTDLYELGSMRLWNYNFEFGLDRGARTIDVYTSVDNVHFDLLTTIQPQRGSGSSAYTGEKFDFGGTVARYVRLDITESYGASGEVGLAEVRFFGDVLPVGDLLPVTSVTTSNPNGAGSVIQMVNGSGLDADRLYHDGASANRHTSNFDTTPTWDFQLGAVAQIDKVHVWNYTAGNETDRGVREVRVLTSIDGTSFVDQGVYEIERGSGSRTIYHAINFQTAPLTASHVRFEVLSTHGDANFVGLSEVGFFGTPISAAPTNVVLSGDSDLGFSSNDGLTALNNASPDSTLDFLVQGTQTGDLVAVYADGIEIGSVVATQDTTVVTTDGSQMLLDGSHVITATRTGMGELISENSPRTTVEIETTAPTVEVADLAGGVAVDALDLVFSEAVQGFDLGDLMLSREGLPLDLSGAQLHSIDSLNYQLTGLRGLTNVAGNYVLDLVSGDNGITDVAGNLPPALDESIDLIAPVRAYGNRKSPVAIVEHDDAFLIDEGEVSLSFQALSTRSGALFSKDHRWFGDGGHLTIGVSRGEVFARLQSVDASFQISGGAIEPGVWHDLRFRFGGDGMTLLLDGEIVASDDYTGGLAETSGGSGNREDIAIGISKVRSNAGTNDTLVGRFRGRISNVQIVDGQGERLYSEAVTPYDLASAENVFDGIDDYVQIDHDESLALDEGSIELTFTTQDADLTQGLFSKDNRSFDSGGHLTALIRGGRVEVRLQSETQSYWVRSEPIQAGVEYRIRFEFGSNGMMLFLNGELQDTDEYTGGLGGNDNPLIVGANQWATDVPGERLQDYFLGEIGNVQILP